MECHLLGKDRVSADCGQCPCTHSHRPRRVSPTGSLPPRRKWTEWSTHYPMLESTTVHQDRSGRRRPSVVARRRSIEQVVFFRHFPPPLHLKFRLRLELGLKGQSLVFLPSLARRGYWSRADAPRPKMATSSRAAAGAHKSATGPGFWHGTTDFIWIEVE